jgi:GT2 family glycosyltransferase
MGVPALTPDADVIILSWDRIDDTIEAIESALGQEGAAIQVIVVDQGSEAEGLARLSAYCSRSPNVRLIKNARNVGVPGGRNQGAAAGSAETIVFLDNDAVFASAHCVRRAVERLRAEPELGALSLAVACYDAEHGVTPDMSSWVYGARQAPAWWRECFRERKFVGCGAVLRRSAFDEVGGFDPQLFFLHEEEDLSERLINRGFAIAYAGDIAIRHKVSPQNRKAWSGQRMFYHARNRLYLDLKQGRSFREMLSDAAVILVAGLRGGSLWSALLGTASGLLHIRSALAARGSQPFIARTPEGANYLQRLADEERVLGVSHPLDQYKGCARFLRRLKWETGFARRAGSLSQAPKPETS